MPPPTLKQTLGMKNSLSCLCHKRMTLTNSFHSMHRKLSNVFQCFCQVRPGKEFSKETTGYQWRRMKKYQHFHSITLKVLKGMRMRLCNFKLLFLHLLAKSTQSGTWKSTKVLLLNKHCCGWMGLNPTGSFQAEQFPGSQCWEHQHHAPASQLEQVPLLEMKSRC